MVILRRVIKEVDFRSNSSIFTLFRMAWHSTGSDNADLIKQLEGKYLFFTKKPILIQTSKLI